MRVEMLIGCAAGMGLGDGVVVGVGGAVAVGEAVGVGVRGGGTVGVGVGVVGAGVGEAEGVGVGVVGGVGVGVGDPGQSKNGSGDRIPVPKGVPVLKKPIVADLLIGGRSESKRKLYSVPQRSAFAFWFCAKVSELQVSAVGV
jgi:hypothetical protein